MKKGYLIRRLDTMEYLHQNDTDTSLYWSSVIDDDFVIRYDTEEGIGMAVRMLRAMTDYEVSVEIVTSYKVKRVHP